MIDCKKVNYSKLGFFRFKKTNKDYLLTNDIGDYIFLSPMDFDQYLQGKLEKKSSKYLELKRKNFIGDEFNLEQHVEKYRRKNQFLFSAGPSLHIVVVTLRCDHKCVYCQASSCFVDDKNKDLSEETARKIVDYIFSSPNKNIAIEFQGGEPLLNWPVVKFIIEYALKKNKEEKRDLELRLVSNFTGMDEEKMNYLLKKGVIFCTSLDGPEKLHNKNRILINKNSHQNTVKWLKKILKKYKKYYIYQPGALTTVTRYSLPVYEKIIDQYIELGLDNIILRPLTPLGMARKTWQKIGYSTSQFLEFYRKSLDYILELNIKKGLRFREMIATNMLTKILTDKDPNYFELRSPCGAGIGQALYNYNGDVYTCDEGRMIGEETFKIGSVLTDSYDDIIDNPTIRTMCLASCLDNLPCDNCVYKPYCGTCPIISYVESGNIFPQLPTSSRCQLSQGIFDYIFKKMQEDDKIKKIFLEWATSRHQFNKKLC
ncbi:His-Xaa-Ser system radical SAM maturase HxsB [Patescibacteria group bacterium]|nr:His-Xaa-Ser system radical SAM maturase HxsB [Patescibacteria group bacterium]